ncbi:MAG: glycerate kinase, partial [Sphingobacteriales bacterium]
FVNDAFERGARRIILGLGGSATNDAGIGILAALGFRFLDADKKELMPTGESLVKIITIIPPPIISSIRFEIAADVENPLYGPDGAAYVYGPQKGADAGMVQQLDLGLKNIADVIKSQFDKEIAFFPGAGAAGGIAAGLAAFFEVEMKRGVDLVLNANGLEQELPGATLIITGEGKIDNQSGLGKVVGTMAALADKYEVPCIAFCGMVEATPQEIAAIGLKAVYPLETAGLSLEESMANGYSLLRSKTEEVIGAWL